MHRPLICIICVINISWSTDIYPGDSEVREGVHAFYNYEFEHSIKILDRARQTYPDHPGVHFIWAAAKYYCSQGLDPVIATYDTLEQSLNKIQPIYESLVKKYPNDPAYQLYLGSARGLRARSNLGKKEWLTLLIQAYQGFSIIEDVADKNPNLMDAQLPIGIVEYYAGISNIIIRWAVELFGLNASKLSGIAKISQAANHSEWAWIEASGILSFLYLWIENKPELALPITKKLVKQFPQNFYFNLLYLESLIRTEQSTAAQDLIHILEMRRESLTRRQQDWYDPYLDYEKALFAFNRGDLELSLGLVNKTIMNYTGELDIVLGFAYLLKGKILDTKGDRRVARTFYQNCLDLDNFSYAVKEAEYLFTVPYIAQ